MSEWPEPAIDLGLYVHIPFCARKCGYCDFASGPYSDAARAAYLKALVEEIANNPFGGSQASTVFLGGGTPSELTPRELAEVTAAIRRAFRVSQGAEWSIECNPGTVDCDFFHALQDLGFNRISLGVQSFDDARLRELGRSHTAREARRALGDARASGFDNMSLDLMFALPGQTLRQWSRDLETAIALEPPHLSLYELTIEPGTQFGRLRERGLLEETGQDLAADMYELALDRSSRSGYEHYEISNFARPGRRCRHNLRYWNNDPVLGFGVSAVSFIGGRRWGNTRNLNDYCASAPSGRPARVWQEQLNARRALGEEIMLRLRTREGVSLEALSRRYRLDAGRLFSQALKELDGQGLLRRKQDRIRLTRRGKLLANEVALAFL